MNWLAAAKLIALVVILVATTVACANVSSIPYEYNQQWPRESEQNDTYLNWDTFTKNIKSSNIEKFDIIINQDCKFIFAWKMKDLNIGTFEFKKNGINEFCESTDYIKSKIYDAKKGDHMRWLYLPSGQGDNQIWIAISTQNVTNDRNISSTEETDKPLSEIDIIASKPVEGGKVAKKIPTVLGELNKNYTIVQSELRPKLNEIVANISIIRAKVDKILMENETVYVSKFSVNSENFTFGSIGEAILHAKSRGIVRVGRGSYNETVHIEKPITLLGLDKNNTYIGGKEGASIYVNSSFVQVMNFSTCLAPYQSFLNLPQNVFRPEKLNNTMLILIR